MTSVTRHPATRSLAVPLALAALAALALPAGANQINTGGSTGAYETSFCPVLAQQLKLAQFDYRCTPSAGTRENMERVLANPRQLGYGQLDVFALESRQMKAEAALTIVRQDDVRECVFAVTRNKDISNWGELAANAGTSALHPAAGRPRAAPAPSSSCASIDADGLGKAKSVTNAASTEEAIREALSADDTVSLFVQFADPDSRALRAGRQARRPHRAGDRPHHPAPGGRRARRSTSRRRRRSRTRSGSSRRARS